MWFSSSRSHNKLVLRKIMKKYKLGWIESLTVGVHSAICGINPVIGITVLAMISAPMTIINWNPWYYPLPTMLWFFLTIGMFLDSDKYPRLSLISLLSLIIYHICWIFYFAIVEKSAFVKSWILWVPHVLVCLLSIVCIIKLFRKTSVFSGAQRTWPADTGR